MRIALVTVGRFLESKGGAEKVLCNMANEFVKRGHEVGVFCCDKKTGKPGYELSEKVGICNIYSSSLKMKWLSIYRELYCLFVFDKDKKKLIRAEKNIEIKSPLLTKEIGKFAPDVIVTFQMESTRMLDSPEISKIPVVTMLHANPSIIFDSKLFPLYKKSVEKSSYVQVLMPEFIEEAKQYIDANVICIPNIVPIYHRCSNLTSKTIINVARIDRKQKRQHLLIEAFSLLTAKFPEWRLEFWGDTQCDPKYTEELHSQIKALNLQDKVKFCGPTDHIEEKLLSASIFAFPSSFEGFGLALTEAMSAGLPAIGCKCCPAVNSIIKDGINGFLCESTPEDLAKNLEILMNSEQIRRNFGRCSRQEVKQYSAQKIWNTWENLLLEISQ